MSARHAKKVPGPKGQIDLWPVAGDHETVEEWEIGYSQTRLGADGSALMPNAGAATQRMSP